MLRRSMVALTILLLLAVGIQAADKEVKCTLVKVDVKKKILTVQTTDRKEHRYEVVDDTKFIGPKGGASEEGIKDDRLVKGAELTLVVAGNNRTLREVHLPRRSSEKEK
jgi:hypothetical protein